MMNYTADFYDGHGTLLLRLSLPEPLYHVSLPVGFDISWRAPESWPVPVALKLLPRRRFQLVIRDHQQLTYREISDDGRILKPSEPRASYDVETSTNEDLDTWILAMQAEVQRRRVGP